MYSDESSTVSFVGQPAWRALRTSGRGAGHGAASAFRRPSSPALHVRRSLCRVAWRMLGGVGGGGGGMRPWNKPGAPVGGTPDNVIQPAREDVLLGQLVYMEPELLPKYIESNMEEFDEDFYKFVEQKIENSQDLEERVTLRTLLEAITDLMKQLLDEKAPPADAKARPEANGADGAAPAASAIASSSGGTAAAPIGTSEQRKMLEALLALHDSADRLQVAVETNYERFDAHFLEYLSARGHQHGDEAADGARRTELAASVARRRCRRHQRQVASSGRCRRHRRGVLPAARGQHSGGQQGQRRARDCEDAGDGQGGGGGVCGRGLQGQGAPAGAAAVAHRRRGEASPNSLHRAIAQGEGVFAGGFRRGPATHGDRSAPLSGDPARADRPVRQRRREDRRPLPRDQRAGRSGGARNPRSGRQGREDPPGRVLDAYAIGVRTGADGSAGRYGGPQDALAAAAPARL
eukprot:ctg_630.g256